MTPTFDDEFLLKLFESLHVYTNKEKNQSLTAVVKLIGALSANPYNAFRLVDLFSFMLFLFPRRSKITNEPLNQNGLMTLIEIPVLILDKSLSFRAEVDNKYWKAANYITVINLLL